MVVVMITSDGDKPLPYKDDKTYDRHVEKLDFSRLREMHRRLLEMGGV